MVDSTVRRVHSLIFTHPKVTVAEVDIRVVEAEHLVAFKLHRNLLYNRPPKVVNNGSCLFSVMLKGRRAVPGTMTSLA